MSIVSSLKYPLVLGKSEKNQLDSKGGEILQGRWVNKEEDFEKPVKWEKVKSWGNVVDRSLTKRADSSSYNELAVLTKYENPNNEMPQVELLPIDSELFDTDEEPDVSKIEEYTDILSYSTSNKVSKMKEEKKNVMHSWYMVWGSFLTLTVLNLFKKPIGGNKR